MARFSTLTGDFWGGYCPECLTLEAVMYKNADGFWECCECNLQITTDEKVVVLPNHGVGHFVKNGRVKISVLDVFPPQVGIIRQDMRV